MRRRWWLIGVAVAVGSLAGFVGYVWLSRALAQRDARSTLDEAIPADSRVLDESIFHCARDDDAGPPYCGTASDVRSRAALEVEERHVAL